MISTVTDGCPHSIEVYVQQPPLELYMGVNGDVTTLPFMASIRATARTQPKTITSILVIAY